MNIMLFNDGFILDEDEISRISDIALKVIYAELSKETQRTDVIDEILKFSRRKLETVHIEL